VKIRTFIPDSKLVLAASSLIFVPTSVAYILYKTIPIQNVNPLSILSVTASINAILWILVVLQIFLNYSLIRKYSFRTIVQFNLFLILIYISTFKILIKALSLKGTPLPGSDIRGDLLAIFGLAKVAKDNFWSGGSYPPLWPSLIGNFARILDVNVLYLFKPAEFIVLIVSPVLVLYIWRLILGDWMALVVTINQNLAFNFDYKTLTLNLILPLLIYVIIKAKDATIMNENISIYYGLVLGIISLTYYGYLYWLIPLLAVISSLLLISKDKERYLDQSTYLFLGLGLGLGPVIYRLIIENVYLYYLAVYGIYLYYVVVFGIILLSFLLRKSKKIKILFNYLINVVLLFGLIGAFFKFRANDTWVEGGVEKNDPTVSSIVNLRGVDLILFFVLILGIYLIAQYKKDFTVIVILTGVYLSSAVFMYFIASQMQVTSKVDLWPRAQEVQGYALNLIFLIITLYICDIVLNELNIKKYLELSNKNFYYLVGFILFILGSYLVGSLGALAHRSMPYHAFNAAWYAHQGCSNPHEDPMLSKVFETYPDIQAFLRDNCSSVDWPVIPNKS
jgi:hypothetical protein